MHLKVQNVGKRYRGGKWGLREFSLEAGPGVLGLLGPNGAGKSTLMRILATVTRPTAGRVTWDGADLAEEPDAVREVLGYLPQDFGVYPHLSAEEFLGYLAAVKGLGGQLARRRVAEMLLGAAWIWPLAVWSAMGCRERDHGVEEQIRQGKSVEDARAGGCSGCVEVGAFGKEAYILTGYFNLVKVLEVTLHDGLDPRTGRRIGPRTGAPETLATFEQLFAAYRRQLRHFIDIKVRGNQLIERLYAREMPAPFLSALIDDCIARGKDYNAGGARYNNTFIQAVGIGTLTDCLAALKAAVYERQDIRLGELVEVLGADFEGREPQRTWLATSTSAR